MLFIALCFSGFVSCKNDGNQNQQMAADTLRSDSLSATADSISRDSALFVFKNVLDSVYQRSSKHVLTALMRGQERYSKQTAFVYRSDEKIPDSLNRRKPFLILSDIDLPQSPEKIFDMKRSMFMQLSAPACLTNSNQVAVIEYAVKYSGTKVIIVLANSNSRVIGAACDNVQTGSFGNITGQLAKAMNTAQEFADRSSTNRQYVNNVAQNQAALSMNQILLQSPEIKAQAESGQIMIKSAFFDSEKGTVTFPETSGTLNTLTKN